jgi:hypothetical protein
VKKEIIKNIGDNEKKIYKTEKIEEKIGKIENKFEMKN